MCRGSTGVVTSWHAALQAVLGKHIPVLSHRERDVEKLCNQFGRTEKMIVMGKFKSSSPV